MAARRAALVALLVLGAGSLAFDLTLPLRLPSDQDWAEAAGALRAAARSGDAVQIWPAWAERARLFVDAMPVLAEEDLANLDDPAVRRLWVLSLPRTPGTWRVIEDVKSDIRYDRAGPLQQIPQEA